MKNFILTAMAMIAGLAMASQPKGQTLSFATEGPDLYADGTTVLDGEQYALVHVNAGQTFAGFLADGTLADPVNNQLVCKASAAKDGKCDQQNVTIAEGVIPKGGSFVVVMLDTRVLGGGFGDLVNGYGVAEQIGNAKLTDAGQSFASLQDMKSTQGKAVGFAPGTPAGVPSNPEITGIEVVGTKVRVKVRNTSSQMSYRLASKTDAKASGWTQPMAGVKGKASASEELVIEEDVKEGVKLFKVVGPTVEQ